MMVSHSFIAYRGDRLEESQPITFAGDSLAVTSRFPYRGTCEFGTVCPLGSTAVLINGSRTFTDIICSVDPSKTGCGGLMDGERTLSDSPVCSGGQQSGGPPAVSFFERLWQYESLTRRE
jgi:hypothetical protein